jgi:hypothetical protein
MNKIAAELRTLGHEIVSSWHNIANAAIDAQVVEERFSGSVAKHHASRDWRDVVNCDVLIFFSDGPDQPARGGKDTELGIAMALNREIIIIGERTNIFHSLYNPFIDIDAFLSYIKEVS